MSAASKWEPALYVALGSALAAAALYFLIGFQIMSIGHAASGGTTDILGFGVTAGITYLVFASLMALVQRRVVWAAIALVDLAVIIAYFAMSNLRVPPFEVWGLTVKAAQLILFGALAYLVFRRTAIEPS